MSWHLIIFFNVIIVKQKPCFPDELWQILESHWKCTFSAPRVNGWFYVFLTFHYDRVEYDQVLAHWIWSSASSLNMINCYYYYCYPMARYQHMLVQDFETSVTNRTATPADSVGMSLGCWRIISLTAARAAIREMCQSRRRILKAVPSQRWPRTSRSMTERDGNGQLCSIGSTIDPSRALPLTSWWL